MGPIFEEDLPRIDPADPRAVFLGCLMHHPHLARVSVAAPEWLGDDAFARLFVALRDGRGSMRLPDIVACSELDPVWLSHLFEVGRLSSERDVHHAASMVLDHHRRQGIRDACRQMQSAEWNARFCTDEIASKGLDLLKAVQCSGAPVAMALRDAVDAAMSPQAAENVVPVPYRNVAQHLGGGGLAMGHMHVVMGETSFGKSIVIKDVGLYAAEQGYPVVYATIEDDPADTVGRMIAGKARIRLAELRRMRQQCALDGADEIDRVIAGIKQLPISFVDRQSAHIDRLGPAIRRAAYTSGARLILVDYIQRIRGRARQGIYERMNEAVHLMLDLASDTGAAVLVASQRNRSEGNRSAKGAGEIIEEASTAMIVERTETPDGGLLDFAQIRISKQKNGPRAVATLNAPRGLTTFEDATEGDRMRIEREMEAARVA